MNDIYYIIIGVFIGYLFIILIEGIRALLSDLNRHNLCLKCFKKHNNLGYCDDCQNILGITKDEQKS